jgi:hypothetical protein
VHEGFKEGLAEGSIREELMGLGFTPESFEERLTFLAADRRRSVRAWGIGQVLIGSAILLAGLGLTVGTYMIAGSGGKYLIMTGLILVGAATLGRGLQALLFRD